MNKIIAGVIGLVLVTAVAAGAAKAALSSQATVQGISISAGSADLQVWDGVAYGSNWNTGLSLNNVYPNFTSTTTNLWLKNNSTAAVSLSVAALLTSAGGDWADLKDKVELTIDDGSSSVTHTLDFWNTTGDTLPGGTLTPTQEKLFTLVFHVVSSAGNEIAGKSINNVTFTLTGTQI